MQINGIGKANSLKVTLDKGSFFYLQKFQNPDMMANDVYLTPPNHYAIGPLQDEETSQFTWMSPLDDNDAPWYQVKIELSYISTTTKEFRNMKAKTRECFYTDEIKLKYFPVYSEPNCLLECAWELAFEKCKCVPWFLIDYFKGAPTCEIYGNKCFANIVDQRYEMYIPCKAECLQDCERVEYKYVHTKQQSPITE